MVPHLRSFKNNQSAGIASYVMIMFGMTAILYMFGFESLWTEYTRISLNGSDMEISSNNAINFGTSILNILLNSFEGNLALGGTVLAAIGVVITRFVAGGQAAATVLQYVIPIILLGVLNIFIFPMNGLSADLGFVDAAGISMTLVLFAFFNIFYILAVIEFVRGNA